MVKTMALQDVVSRLKEEISEAAVRQPPSNVTAEQSLLGAILVNNHELQYIGDFLRPEHFYEPVHQRIFEAILKFHDKGMIANPITLKHYFDGDEALQDIGGAAYLVKLAGAAVTVINARDYSHMIYDLALKRALITIGEDVVNTAYDHKIDAGAERQIEHAEQQLFTLSTEGMSDRGFQPLKTSLQLAVTRTEKAFKNAGHLTGVDTGLVDMNKMLGGLQRSDLIILAGRPSMGKTALATNIAYNACKSFAAKAAEQGLSDKERQSVGFFSLEMSAEQLATRILAAACQISPSHLIHGTISHEQFPTLVHKSQELSSLPFHIDDTPALSIAALRARARRLKRTANLGLLVVDYLQLVRPASLNSDNRVQEVSEITQGLKAIAKELDVPVIALSQLSRAVEQREDKRPQLSDLRESGSIEQDSDVVMFIFREEYYESRNMPNAEDEVKFRAWQERMNKIMNVADIMVAKHRQGPIGTVKLHFNANLTHFDNLAESSPSHH